MTDLQEHTRQERLRIVDDINSEIFEKAKQEGIPRAEIIRLAKLCKDVYNADRGFYEIEEEKGYGQETPIERASSLFYDNRAKEINKMLLDFIDPESS